MSLVSQAIKLYAWKSNNVRFLAVEGEADSRMFYIQLYNTSAPIDLTNSNVKFFASKPDSTSVYCDCTIVDDIQGIVQLVLPEQMTTVSGDVDCWIQVTSADGSDLRFEGMVLEVASCGLNASAESSDDMETLREASQKVDAFTTELRNARFGEDSLGEKIEKMDRKSASNSSRIDSLVAGATEQDQNFANEVIDARTDSTGTTHSSLGEALRATDALVRECKSDLVDQGLLIQTHSQKIDTLEADSTSLKSDLSEQTRNLLNSKIYTTDDFEYVNGVFRNIKTDSRAYTQLYILQYSDSTLISEVCNVGIANGSYKRIYQFEASEGVNRIRIGHNGVENDLRIYFDDVNLISGETYTISVFLDGNDPTAVGGLTFKDIQIEAGNTASDYIPMFSATDYTLREKYNKEVSGSLDMWNDSVDILKTSGLTIVDKTVLNNNKVSSSASGITAFVKLTEGETYYFTRGIVDNRALYIGFSDGTKMGANLIGFKQVKDQENYKLQEDGYNPFVFTVPNGYPYFAFTYYFTGYETKSYTASEILNSFSLFKYKYHMIDADNRNILNDIVNPLKTLFENEINRVVSEAKSKMSSKCMCIGIITDTHIDATNDIYNKISMFNMKAVNEHLNFDICANLGDVIDGGETKEIETKFMSEGISRIVKVGAKKCFAVLGNHDNNGLGSELFTDEEIYGNMLQFSESEVIRDGITSNFYVDYESLKIRIIVVDSCYNTQGFSDTTVYWITDVLANTPNDYKFVILSHEPTRGSLISTTSSESFNSANIEGVLDNYKDRIFGYIHGHTHFDNVSYVNGYPEISITCGQPYQYPSTNFPSGAVAPERIIGSITQDAWDIVLVLPEEGKFEFIRFGAGESRTIPFRQ